mgnify:CR=1 FL=1
MTSPFILFKIHDDETAVSSPVRRALIIIQIKCVALKLTKQEK